MQKVKSHIKKIFRRDHVREPAARSHTTLHANQNDVHQDSLRKAVEANSEEDCRNLKKNFNVDPNTAYFGRSILPLAVYRGRTGIVQTLIDIGADVHKSGHIISMGAEPRTSIEIAVREANLSILSLLLRSGADLEAKLDTEWNTAVHRAAELNKVTVIRWLLQKGVNFSSENIFGRTPLHVAELMGNKASIDVLKTVQAKEMKAKLNRKIRIKTERTTDIGIAK